MLKDKNKLKKGDIKVNDVVGIIHTSRRYGNLGRVVERTVITIGNKYGTLDNHTKFYLDGGLEKSDFSSSFTVYRTLDIANSIIERDKLIIDNRHFFSHNFKKLTTEQLKRIIDISKE